MKRYQCLVCKLEFTTEELARQCEEWCLTHDSCNLEIGRQALNRDSVSCCPDERFLPLAVLNYTPRSRYYGAATTSAFYPVVLSEAWHWTGDKDLIRDLFEPAGRALQWLDEYGDSDRDGFYDYHCRSMQGNANQGWKDSGDAMVHEDGSQVVAPIATCEEQAFAYAAKLQMSEVCWWLDEKEGSPASLPRCGRPEEAFS